MKFRALLIPAIAGALLAGLVRPAAAQKTPSGQDPILCDLAALYDTNTNGATQLVAAVAAQKIYVCGYAFQSGGTATNMSLVYGAGSNCATNQTALTPAYQLGVKTALVDENPFGNAVSVPAGKALCLLTSAGNAVQALVRYTQF